MIPCHQQPLHANYARKRVRAGADEKVLKGKLTTGEHMEAHETTLPPNAFPHPPHHHMHLEMWLGREGTVELTIHGAARRLSPGGLGLVRLNEEHGIKRVGLGPASCFVVAIGTAGDA